MGKLSLVKPHFAAAAFVIFGLTQTLFAQHSNPTDLYIESVQPVSGALHHGDWVKFKVKVKNGGAAEVSNVKIDLYKNQNTQPTAGARGQIRHLITRIEPGQSVSVDFYYQVQAGTYQTYFQVDPDQKVAESDEENNFYAYSLSVAGERPDDPYEENDTFQSASNVMPSSASLFEENLVSKDIDYYKIYAQVGSHLKVELHHDYVTSNIDLELYDENNNLVASSATHSDIERIVYQSKTTGNYRLKVIGESENPNPYFLSIWRGEMPDYTIAISDIRHSLYIPIEGIEGFPEPAQYNTPLDEEEQRYMLEVTLKVTNGNVAQSGQAPPDFAPFYVDLFFNRTLKPSLGDIGEFFGKINKSHFEHSISSTEQQWRNYATIKFSIVVGAGSYTLSSIVDTGDEVVETSESNNIGQMAYRIVAGPSGAIADVDPFEPQSDIYPGAQLESGRHENLMAWDGYEFYHVNVPAGKKLDFSIDFEHSLGDLNLFQLSTSADSEIASSTSLTNRESISVWNTSSSAKTYKFRVGNLPLEETVYVRDQNGNLVPKTLYHFVQNPNYNLNVAISDWRHQDVKIQTISVTPQNPLQGEDVIAKVLVKNSGLTTIETATLDFYRLLSTEPAPQRGDLTPHSLTLEPLSPGESRELSFTMAASQGQYSLYAFLDPAGAIAESDEDNNNYGPVTYLVYSGEEDDPLESREVVIDGKTKIIENDKFSKAAPIEEGNHLNLKAFDEDWYFITVSAGKRLSATASFDSASGDIDLALYKKVSFEIELASGETTTLESSKLIQYGGSIGDTESLSYFNETGQDETIFVLISPKSSNNYNIELIQHQGSKNQIPDLVIDSAITTPVNPMGGDLITTTVAVRNAGEWVTPADATLDLYHSSVPRAGAYGDTFRVVPGGIKPGETRYFTFEYTLSGGGYAIYLVVDPDNSVVETSETNNLYGPIELQVAGASNGNISIGNLAASLSGNTVSASFDMPNTTQRTDFYLKFRLKDGASPESATLYEWTKWYQDKYDAVGAPIRISYQLAFDAYVPQESLYLEAVVDWGNWVGETDESDNRAYSGALLEGQTSPLNSVTVATFGAPRESKATDTIMEIYRYGGSQVAAANTSVSAAELGSPLRVIDGANPYASATLSLPSGYYFARVYSYGNSTGPYYFAVGGSGVWSVTGGEAIDESDGDDSFSTASFVGADAPQRVSISHRADEDWFSFLVHSVQLDFASNNNVSVVEAKVYRYNPNSQTDSFEVGSVTSADLTQMGGFRIVGQSLIFESPLAAGIYFVEVSGSNKSYSAVVRNNDLSLQKPTLSAVEDSFEGDHTPAAAKPIGYNSRQDRTLYRGSTSANVDVDWFYFTIDTN